MKVSRDKILTLVIGSIILAGTGGYALADQAARPSAATVSSEIASSAVSQVPSVSEVSKTEVSSMEEQSTTSQEVSNTTENVDESVPNSTPESAPEAEPKSTPAEDNPSSEQETSMKPGVLYYNVIDPDTGWYVQPRDPRYFEIRNRLGGDAGTVPPNKSTACAPYIQKWKQIEQEKDRAENKQLAPESKNPENIDAQ